MRYFKILSLFISLAVAESSFAQTTSQSPADGNISSQFPPGSPEWVTQESVDALQKHAFGEYAELFHPDDVDLMTRYSIVLIKTDTTGPLFRSIVGPDGSAQTFLALKPRARLAKMLETFFSRGGDMNDALSRVQIRMLGHVIEDDSLAHVVYRGKVTYRGNSVNMCGMTNLKKEGGQWYVLLDDDKRMMFESYLKNHASDE